MPLKIRLKEHDLMPADLNELHFKLMDQQCPVHFKSPYVETNHGEIEYTCCCEQLKALCMLVLAMSRYKKSNKVR